MTRQIKCDDCQGKGWTWVRWEDNTNRKAECWRCEGEGVVEVHDVNCDVNDKNPEGIKKPCNCGYTEEDINWYRNAYAEIKRLYNHYRFALITAVGGLKEMHDVSHQQQPDLAHCDVCQLLQSIAEAQAEQGSAAKTVAANTPAKQSEVSSGTATESPAERQA